MEFLVEHAHGIRAKIALALAISVAKQLTTISPNWCVDIPLPRTRFDRSSDRPAVRKNASGVANNDRPCGSVLEAAGGVVVTLSGDPLRYGKSETGFIAWGRNEGHPILKRRCDN